MNQNEFSLVYGNLYSEYKKDLLTIDDLTKILDIKKPTIYMWLRQGSNKLPKHKKINMSEKKAYYRFSLVEVVKFILTNDKAY